MFGKPNDTCARPRQFYVTMQGYPHSTGWTSFSNEFTLVLCQKPCRSRRVRLCGLFVLLRGQAVKIGLTLSVLHQHITTWGVPIRFVLSEFLVTSSKNRYAHHRRTYAATSPASSTFLRATHQRRTTTGTNWTVSTKTRIMKMKTSYPGNENNSFVRYQRTWALTSNAPFLFYSLNNSFICHLSRTYGLRSQVCRNTVSNSDYWPTSPSPPGRGGGDGAGAVGGSTRASNIVRIR